MKITPLLAASAILLSACGPGSDNVTYQVVVDAGSTGSRAYVYQIDQSTPLPTITNVFSINNNIALSNFSGNPDDAGPTAIQPLLDSAEAFLSDNYGVDASDVVASVLGTGGMRQLPASAQNNIYRSVADTVFNESFSVGTVATISGRDEGLFAWLDVNYLQNNFSGNATKGIIEVGGASAQIAFASTSSVFGTTKVTLNGNDYFVYSIGFLGLGQDQARLQMNSTPNYNNCYPNGYSNGPFQGNFNFNSCANNYAIVTSDPNYAGLDSINTTPGFNSQQFVGISGVYFALNFWNITTQPTQALLEQNINTTCSKTYSELLSLYPNAFQLFNQCANASYIDGLLYNDLALASNQLSATNSINGTPITYTLGYVLFNSI